MSFDAAADDNYVAEGDRQELNLPIIAKSTKAVFITNGSAKQGKHETELTLDEVSTKARVTDSFETFRTTLISGSKVVDDGNTAILDRKRVKVHEDEDVLILVKGKPVMIEKRDAN